MGYLRPLSPVEKYPAAMKIQDVVSHLEQIAPPALQESYDNAGLIVGDRTTEVTGVVVCLDAIEAVVDEAIRKQCNLIVAHHPIIFRGLKRLTGQSYIERTVMKAIRHDVAIYAIHTNLDNIYRKGVNSKIAERLGLQDTHILQPKQELLKIVAWSPKDLRQRASQLLADICESGAFESDARWLPGAAEAGNNRELVQMEGLILTTRRSQVIDALAALGIGQVECSPVIDTTGQVGAGMVGELAQPVVEESFLLSLKNSMCTGMVRHTRLRGRPVQRVAVCGGAGSFLLPEAIAQGADVFVTGDFKYHEFFDAEGKIVIADIGHFESEQFTIELLREILLEKFSTFAVRFTEVRTNPVFYI
jgi:dinuclear metal center YbgI/SA1388 family protein